MGDDVIRQEAPVEMRKQCAVAGCFPAYGIAERREIDRGDDEIGSAGKMFFHGLRKLRGGGEVDVAVRLVDRRPCEGGILQGSEFKEREDLEGYLIGRLRH